MQKNGWRLLCLMAVFLPFSAVADPLADGVAALNGKQYPEALRILTPLANGGDDEAQRLLGEMIFKGQGVKRNLTAALSWTKLSAENGNRVGQYNMGYLHEQGAGVSQSQREAIIWYTRSARQQYVLAQRRLGEIYETSDMKQAQYWYDQARTNGDEVSLRRYEALTRTIAEIEAPLREAERAAEQAEKAAQRAAAEEEFRREQEENRASNGNWAAQGIAEGLTQFRRDSARVSRIHDRAMADIQGEANERARRKREQEARLRTQETRQRADEARDAAESRTKLAMAEAQERMRQAAPAREASAASGAAASPLPLYQWTVKYRFRSQPGRPSEQDARDQVAKTRAHQETLFRDAVARHAAGKHGKASWREVRLEPVACHNKSSDPARPGWQCSQRADYAVSSTETSMGDTVYTLDYGPGLN